MDILIRHIYALCYVDSLNRSSTNIQAQICSFLYMQILWRHTVPSHQWATCSLIINDIDCVFDVIKKTADIPTLFGN